MIKMIGLWEIVEEDVKTGEILNTQIVKNVLVNQLWPFYAQALSNGDTSDERLFNAVKTSAPWGWSTDLKRYSAFAALGTSSDTPLISDTNLGHRDNRTIKKVNSITRIDRNVIYFAEWGLSYPQDTYLEAGIWEGSSNGKFNTSKLISHVKFNQPANKGENIILRFKASILTF